MNRKKTRKRKVTFGVGNSLDNYIARLDDGIDWLRWTSEIAQVTAEYWKRVDSILLGRKTYEAALRHSKKETEAQLYSGMKSYILSRTLPPSSAGPAEIAADAVELVRKLQGERGKEICVLGGGELARSLFEAQLIDEVVVNIHPVLLGSGIPLFHQMQQQIDLRLLETRTFKNGCVLLAYRVKH